MEIKRIEDYYKKVQERFPDLTEKEVEDILRYGFKSFYMLSLMGGDILIKTNYFTAYIGEMFSDVKKFWKYWRLKNSLKLRIKSIRKKKLYDGYYYIGIREDDYIKYGLDKKKGRKTIVFDTITMYKLKEESFLDLHSKYFYRISMKEESNFVLKFTNFKTNQISLIAKRGADGKINFI